MNVKYTKEKLEEAVKQSKSVIEVMKILGLKSGGGSHGHITKRIKFFGIDISHFQGKSWTKGRVLENRRLKPEEILVENKKNRINAHLLRRGLIESGIEYQCSICSIKEWMKTELTLQVDHIDGDWTNNNIDNLRFLCPNCHSQTDTYGYKKRNK